jgi:hypothetical protein
MSTIIVTPSGMVEAGADFHGNLPPTGRIQSEVGGDFEGNAPISTPTVAENIKETQ